MKLVSYCGSLADHQWTIQESREGEIVYVPFEGSYPSRGSRIQSPVIKLDKPAGTPGFYQLSFTALCSTRCAWWIDLFDAEKNLLPDINSAVEPAAEAQQHKKMIYVQSQAEYIQIAFVFKTSIEIRDVALESVSAADAADWCDGVYRKLPEIDTSGLPPTLLPRTFEALRSGTPWRIVMLGDSIMNDSYNSVFQALVKRDYPRSECNFIISVRGATGCWYYQEKENFRSYVADLAPDLLIIGGVSNPHEGDWTGAVEKVIEQAKVLGCEIVLATPPLSYDWRTPDPQNSLLPRKPVIWNEDTLNCKGGKSLQITPYREIARCQNIPLWELTSCCADYLAASEKPLEFYNRDYVHNNDFGKQIIGRVLQQCFRQICQYNL